MDLKRAAVTGLILMMSINIFSEMLNYVGILGLPIQAHNETQVYTVVNGTVVIEPWLGEDQDFYDVSTGIGNWWYKTVPYIESFLYLLQAYRVPAFIYTPIHNAWRFIWFSFITIVVLMGRDV